MNESPVRIVFCTNGGLHGALVLDRLLASPRAKVTGVVLSSRMLRPSDGFLSGAVAYIRRCGVVYAFYLWFSTSLANLLLRLSPLKPVCLQATARGIPLITTRRINDAACRRFVGQVAPDLLVSAFFNQNIGQPLVDLARLGGVNIHPSLLPEFRGVDPAFFAALQRAGERGVSVHRIAPEFDAGDILLREARAADPACSVWSSTAHSYDRGGELLVEALEAIAQGAECKQQTSGGTYDSWPTPAQVVELRRLGVKLWTLADAVNLARGRFPGRRVRRIK